MKIAILSSLFPPITGGVSDNTYVLAKELIKYNNEIFGFFKDNADFKSLVFSKIVTYKNFNLKTITNIINSLEILDINTIIIPYTPFMYGRFSFFIPILLKKLKDKNINSILLIHEIYQLDTFPKPRDFLYFPLNFLKEKLIFKFAKNIISTFKFRQEHIKNKWKRDSFLIPVCSSIPKEINSILEENKEKIISCFGTYHNDMNFIPILDFLSIRSDYKAIFIGNMPKIIKNKIISRYPLLIENQQLIITENISKESIAKYLSLCRYFINFDKRGISTRKSTIAAAYLNSCNIISNLHQWTDNSIFKDNINFTSCLENENSLNICITKLDNNITHRRKLIQSARITGEKYFSSSVFAKEILKICQKD